MKRSFALVLAAVTARSGLAQQPAKPDTAYVLPALSVSVTRHAASPLAVPFALTRITARDLRATKGFGLEEALRRVPGVLAQSRYGTSDVRIVVRGYGARGAGDRSNAGTSRGIRVLLDGFPETEPDGRTSFDGIDLASAAGIEIIRSNASALFGNASGGLISISTLPEFDRGFTEAEVAGGTFGLFRAVARGGAVTGTSRVAGTVVRTEFEGWRRHSNALRTVVNAAVNAQMSPSTRLGLFAMGSSNEFRIPGPLTQAEVDADPRQANPTYASRDERRYNRLGRFGATLEHEMHRGGSLALSAFVTPKFLQRSERGTFRDFTRYHVGGSATYRNRMALGPTARGSLLVGVDEAYQDGAILFYSLTPEGTRGAELRDNKREGANNTGLFVQGEVELGERWNLNLGARYDRVTYYSQSFITPALDDSRLFSRLTPKVGINFRASSTHSFYANIGGGVEVPAGNETDPAGTFGQDTVTSLNPLLEPIRSTTFEVGTKQVMTPEKGFIADLSYDLAVYHTRVTNEIIPYRGGRFYFTAGEVRRTGAELGVALNTRTAWSFSGTLTWSRNKYVDYVVDSVHYGRPGQSADYAGNRMVGFPDWIYNLNLSYQPAILDGLRLSAGVQGEAKYFLDDANTVSAPGFAIVSATASLDDPVSIGGRFGVRAYVTINNLFNRNHIGSAFLNPDIVDGVPVAFEPGLPRTVLIGAALGWR